MQLLALQPSPLLCDLISRRRGHSSLECVPLYRKHSMEWLPCGQTSSPSDIQMPLSLNAVPLNRRSFLTTCIEPLVFVHQKGASKENFCFWCLLCFYASRVCVSGYICVSIYTSKSQHFTHLSEFQAFKEKRVDMKHEKTFSWGTY